MGKDKKSKYGDPAKQWIDSMKGKNRDLEERFGISRVGFGGKPGEGNQREAFQDMTSYNERITDAARNDYDLRRTLEAAAMSGKKKAQDILDRGFNSIDDVRRAQNFSEKAAKRHGQGGHFSSNSDYMGLTQSMVERDRRKFTESIEGMISDATSRDDEDGGGEGIERVAGGSYNDYMEGTFGDRADDISRGWVGETAKATSGFSAGAQSGAGVTPASSMTQDEAAAQDLLASSLRSIASDAGAIAGQKAKQGMYVLNNLHDRKV